MAPVTSRMSNRRGTAVISLDLSATAIGPSVRLFALAQALTRCRAALPCARSGAPGLPVQSDLLEVGGLAEGLDPGSEAARERLRVQVREDVAEGVLGGNAVGQAQERLEPVVRVLAVEGDLGPGVLSTEDCADRDHNDIAKVVMAESSESWVGEISDVVGNRGAGVAVPARTPDRDSGSGIG